LTQKRSSRRPTCSPAAKVLVQLWVTMLLGKTGFWPRDDEPKNWRMGLRVEGQGSRVLIRNLEAASCVHMTMGCMSMLCTLVMIPRKVWWWFHFAAWRLRVDRKAGELETMQYEHVRTIYWKNCSIFLGAPIIPCFLDRNLPMVPFCDRDLPVPWPQRYHLSAHSSTDMVLYACIPRTVASHGFLFPSKFRSDQCFFVGLFNKQLYTSTLQ
jgi:hypothetical protein